jgi:hypothetical protein
LCIYKTKSGEYLTQGAKGNKIKLTAPAAVQGP